MSKNKFCCRIYPFVLILIAVILAGALWYFEEGAHEFGFFASSGEFINYLGTVLFVAIIPIGLFYWLNDKEKYQDKARLVALLGFLPAILLLVFIIL